MVRKVSKDCDVCEKIQDKFKMKNMGDYHNHYPLTLSCHEQSCLGGLPFQRYFFHHRAM